MFKYSTYQKLLLRTGLMMIAIIYSEFSFSQNCNGRIPCHAVPSGGRNVVSPTVRRIVIPTSSEATIPNQSGNTSSGTRRIVIGTSNGANEQRDDMVTLINNVSGIEKRFSLSIVQVDFSVIEAMENPNSQVKPESLVASSGMLAKVPIAGRINQDKYTGEVDIPISPECQQGLKNIIDTEKIKVFGCSTLVKTATGSCVTNVTYPSEGQKELVGAVISTYNDICFKRR